MSEASVLQKSVKESNGYEAYRMLIQDLTPSSRSRVLALMQAIHNWPTFDAKTGVMVQLSKFESAVAECENLSNSKLSDDNKLAAVLRCLTGQLRTQATALITETSTYQDLRGLIERWDTSQTRWSTSLALLKNGLHCGSYSCSHSDTFPAFLLRALSCGSRA